MVARGNQLNLKRGDLDRYVYRIMPSLRLFEMFASRKNTLVSPAKWRDPFENILLHQPFRLFSGKSVQIPYRENFYGQCWTLWSQSAALWQIYAADTECVRVRTTVRRLIEGLCATSPDNGLDSAFIGRVEYMPRKKLVARLREIGSDLDKGRKRDVAKSLYLKRNAFRYEREVRLTYFDFGGDGTDIFHYDVNPEQLIDDILLHPEIPSTKEKRLRRRIEEHTDYSGRVRRSDLYDLVNDFEKPRFEHEV